MFARRPHTAANIALAAALAAWISAGVIAATNWDGALSGGAYAAGSLGAALTVIGLALNARSAIGHSANRIEHAVRQAPIDQYYRGYGDAAEDAFRTSD